MMLYSDTEYYIKYTLDIIVYYYTYVLVFYLS